MVGTGMESWAFKALQGGAGWGRTSGRSSTLAVWHRMSIQSPWGSQQKEDGGVGEGSREIHFTL